MASATPQPRPPTISQLPSTQSTPPDMVAAASASTAGFAAVEPRMSPVSANRSRFVAVVERLRKHFQGDQRVHTSDIIQLYFALAKSIDYAISMGDVPQVASHLPFILKQVYVQRSTAVQSALMVLVIAAKNACQNRWFSDAAADEIISMAKELYGNFCITPSPSETMASVNALDIISKLTERFFPQLRLSRLLTSFDAKPGYDILMTDFNIGRDKSPEEKIRLFISQKDNLQSSSCIVTPSEVSFLVNGKGIDGRTNFRMVSGPQFPSDITRMLKYGTNIIQAVGYFSSTYLIAVAHTLDISRPASILKDYVQPIARSVTTDSDISEGPSTITLNCPISFRRIKTPVKGFLCNHHQCFDYDNFMQMNAKRPSWRCPCCNQPVCFIDLRVVQDMFKILREAGEDANDVVIYADRSWKVLSKHNGNLDQLMKASEEQQDDDIVSECNDNTNNTETAVDLTMENGENDVYESEDRKPFKDSQAFVNSDDLTSRTIGAPPSSGPSTSPQLCVTVGPAVSSSSGFPASVWRSDVVMDPLGTSASSSNGFSTSYMGTNANLFGIFESSVLSSATNPVSMDAVALSRVMRTPATTGGPQPTFSQQTTLAGQNTATKQLQQPLPRPNSIINSTIQRPVIPTQVNRVPNAVQALATQSQAPAVPQENRYRAVRVHHVSNLSSQLVRSTTNASVSSPHSRGTGLDVAPSPSPFRRNSRVHQLLAMRVQQRSTPNLADVQNNLLAQHAEQASRPQPVESANLRARRVATPTQPEIPQELNWRPTGRMRGSLHGAAFEDALSQYLSPVSQAGNPGQANQPGSSGTK